MSSRHPPRDKQQDGRHQKKKIDKKRRRSQTHEDEGQLGKSQDAKKKENSNSKISFPMGACVPVSDRFEKVAKVGQGTYGVVYKARDRLAARTSPQPNSNECFVALKRCIPHYQASDGFPTTTLREIHSLRLLHHHPNIISLRQDISNGVAVSRHDVFLVFEYCEHDLGQLLDHYYHNPKSARMLSSSSSPSMSSRRRKQSPFQESQVKTLLRCLLSALECIHSHGLIHRDCKLSNLLYTHKGQLKICDFGLSRTIAPLHQCDANYHLTPNVVSLWYRPPELLLGSKHYHQSIDVWAAGCIFAELLQGYPLWAGSSESEQLDLIFTTLGVPNPSVWPSVLEMPAVKNGNVELGRANKHTALNKASAAALLDAFSHLSPSGLILMTNLLHYNPDEKRWSAAQALQSKYFSESPLPTPENDMPKFPSLHQ